ncbi:hypothetical protein BC834DRAFT_343531 [Gloeopeniophorella convolvens]|nr:hypothetical protein BC834DRAFT_343531 [Gloeopeniophorella convolvens]
MIFGAIEILLTIPDNCMKNHKTLMRLLEQMACFLKRLEILFVPEDVPYDDATTKMILDILVELISVFALLTQKMSPSDTVILMAKRYIRKVFTMVCGDKEIEHMLRQLDELTSVKRFMDTALARYETEMVERLQQKRERERRAERYRTWLSSPDSLANQVTVSDAHHPGTSKWLVRGRVFESWKSSGTLLWITGKPGAGKTVICSTIINHLRQWLHISRLSAALAYFYCDPTDPTTQSYPSLLGSLLIDLSTQSDESENILRKLHSKYKDGSRTPNSADLTQCLEEMLTIRPDATKYIVVDALDVMPTSDGEPSSREKTMELMSWLLGLGIPGLRICVTSRPEDDIGQVLTPLASHQVVLDEEGEHREDIAP